MKTMTPDAELLATFARTNSEDAFAEVVKRHVNLVYSAALRQTGGDAHLAKDVAQNVFTDLAKKAAALARRDNISGWLYTSAHFAAAKIVRAENRRREREEIFMREPANESAPATEWEMLRPLLDAAMHELKAPDRDAILLRYFENRPFAEVGAKLGLNENAARMRVERALEKLRAVLAKRGVAATATLAAVLSANAVQLAPAGLSAALATTSIAATGTGTFAFMKIMTMTKLKLGFSALAVAGAATAIVVQHHEQQKLLDENGSLQQQVALLKTDGENLSNRLASVGEANGLSSDQLNELLKLRGEAGVLRRQTGELEKLREENKRLQAAQLDATTRPQVAVDPEEQQKEAAVAKMDIAKQGVLGLIMFADDNQQQFPANIAQATPYFGSSKDLIATNFDLVYQGSITNIVMPAETIVLKEKQAWQSFSGKWMKTYGFADGHSEVHTEPNGNFDVYEKGHMILSPN